MNFNNTPIVQLVEEHKKLDMSKYREIGKRSFKSKWKVYLFERTIHSELDKINNQDFNLFQLCSKSIKRYVNEYWQEFEDHKIKGMKISEIYNSMKSYEQKHLLDIAKFERHYIEYEFPQTFCKSEFDSLIQVEECWHCGITKVEIEELGKQQKLRKKNLRGWNLEIDRLEPNKEYSESNCVMSCFWCNNAKTDEFSEEEFKAIGKEIGIALRGRLKR